MADDYSINAKITADASGYEEGIKKAQKATKNLSKSVSGIIQGLGKSGFVGALGAVGLATNGVTSVLGVAKKAFQQVSKTVSECTEAYKKQYKAEVALETVAKNNPFIDGTNVRALKNFASEIQSISNYGDEELLPLIANLTALGRTESESMQIIKTATDMASTGMVSLDTAVNQLNMTLNGNIGRLGVQNAELKNLTEEELKSGKAVEILGKKYEGLAKTTSDTSIQMNNAIGDFKELIGQSFEKALIPMRKYFTEIISNVNDVIKKAREQKEAFDEVFKEEGLNTDAETEKLKIALDSVLTDYRKVYANQQQYLKLYGEYINVETDETAKAYREQIAQLTTDIKKLSEEIVSRKKQAKAEADEQKANEERLATEKEINDLKEKYLKKIAEQEAQWQNIKTVTGEAVKNEERLKFYQDQLVAIMTESGGKISENNQYYKDQMAIIQGIISEIGNPAIQTEWANKLLDQRIEMLEIERDEAIENAENTGEEIYTIWRYYNEKLLSLKLEQLSKEKEKALSEENLTEEEKNNINEYYANEEKKIYKDLEKYKKQQNEKEVKDEESKWQKMLAVIKNVTSKIVNVFSKMANVVGKVFSTIRNVAKNIFNGIKDLFSKMFEFNVDDALDSLLAVEDAILTFFVETLPKLPSFFESAFSSVLILIKTLINAIDWEKVKTILDSIIETFVTYAPQILSGIVELFSGLVASISSTLIENAPDIISAIGEMFFTILEALPGLISNFLKLAGTYLSEIGKYIADNEERLTKDLTDIVSSIVKGISNFIKSGGWKNILSALLTIQKAIENAVTENLPAIVDTIIEALPDLIQFLINSIVSASKNINKVIIPIIKLILAVVEALVDVLTSDEVLDAGLEAFTEFIEIFTDEILPMILKILPKLISKILKFIGRNFTKIVKTIVQGLVKAFRDTDWGEIVKQMFTGFIDGIKDLFGIHSPSTLFEEFGGFMVEGLVNGLKGISESAMAVIQPFLDLIENTFNTTIGGVVDSVKSIVDGFVTLGTTSFDAIKDIIDTIANASFDTVKTAIDSVTDIFKTLSELTFSSIVDLTKLSFDTLKDSINNTTTALKDITEISLKNLSDSLTSLTSISFNEFNSSISAVSSGLYNLANISFSGLISSINAVGSSLYGIINISFSGLTNSINSVSSGLCGIANISFTGLTNSMNAVSSGVVAINNSVGSLIDSLGRLITTATEAVKAINPLSGGSSESSAKTALIDLLVPFGFLQHFATGTQQAQKGMALVGEAGPELVRFNGGEQVINSHNTQKALEGMGGTTINQNVTFNNLQDTTAFAMLQQFKQYNRQMAINGII